MNPMLALNNLLVVCVPLNKPNHVHFSFLSRGIAELNLQYNSST